MTHWPQGGRGGQGGEAQDGEGGRAQGDEEGEGQHDGPTGRWIDWTFRYFRFKELLTFWWDKNMRYNENAKPIFFLKYKNMIQIEML